MTTPADAHCDSEYSSALRYFERSIRRPDLPNLNARAPLRRGQLARVLIPYFAGVEQRIGMIVFTMRITAPPEKRGEMLQALRSLLGPMSVRPGCLRCQLYQDADDKSVITWVEEWESREHLERHVRSGEYRTLLSVMDLSTVQPEVRFNTVVDSTGMELIEATMGRDP